MEGLPFRLDIIESDTQWIVRCSSECGEASVRVPPPYSKSELKTALAQVELSLAKSYSITIKRGTSAPEKSVREFGRRLTESILQGAIGVQFELCKRRAKTDRKPLRVLLRPDGPQVCRIPWEYMVDPSRGDYLALSVPIVRALQLMDPISPVPLSLPLRVLGMSAVPSDLPELDEKKERDRIAHVFQQQGSDKVDVHWLPGDRWQDLRQALQSGTWHVLHCVCHGGFDEENGTGYIQLSGAGGSAMRVAAEDFQRLIGASPHLRLIVLNACESAVSGSGDVFSSTAAALVRAGAPAVVAMQYEITDEAAFVFASYFYERIAEGFPVDRAVMLARDEVKMSLGTLEWATPVLFLASDTTQIFTSGPKEPREPPTTPKRPSSTSSKQPPPPPPPLPPPPETPHGTVIAESGPCLHLVRGPGDLLAVACDDGVVRVLEGRKGELAAQCLPVRGGHPVCLAWSPWRRHVASRHDDGTVVVWDLQTETPALVFDVGGRGSALAFSADGRWLALTVQNRVEIYDTHGVRVRDLPVWPAPVWAAKNSRRTAPEKVALGYLGFTPGDRAVVVACSDGPVRQLDGRGDSVVEWRHPQPILSLAYTEDCLATGCRDGQVRLWSWDGRQLWRKADGRPVLQLAFSVDRPALAVADDRGGVAIRNLHTGTAFFVGNIAGWPVGLGFLDDEGLVTATRTGTIERWSVPDWMAETETHHDRRRG
ncbi:CHAT domain-containing protein [Streptomyces sp. NPDC047081]|uniref:CHAT domain-containing WD40 repeat protein n=1 Tax=Streptomyces sp. NPDC047081 TaxID=3154706 RepID=UPI0033CA0335